MYVFIPEAYRLKFRARKMIEGETHVSFVRNKRLFDLDDQEIGDIYGTDEKADYYALTHKISNKSFKQSSSYRPVITRIIVIAIVISNINGIRLTTNQVTHLQIIDRRIAVIATRKVTMNTNVTKSCVNKTHINLGLHNAQPYKRDAMIQ